MIIVSDASVAVKWYAAEIYTAEAEKILDGTYEIHAPELIMPEFGSIIWKKFRRNDLTEKEVDTIITAFSRQNIIFHSHKLLLKSAFTLARQTGQTVYDCSYLVLAVSLACEFVTADERFYKALEKTKLKKHLLWIGDI
ncbi:MAG: type II toxin-antitoxin system VapC family toxin [Acidobacteria bacterium]|jgi:predicted nucleic acid-binding protein|nr:type II toxin-antitoxin system VapC family toxin [Acidobacteriota bacterium]